MKHHTHIKRECKLYKARGESTVNTTLLIQLNLQFLILFFKFAQINWIFFNKRKVKKVRKLINKHTHTQQKKGNIENAN